jgi:hypothetical protein
MKTHARRDDKRKCQCLAGVPSFEELMFSRWTRPTKLRNRLPRNSSHDKGSRAPINSTASCIKSKKR